MKLTSPIFFALILIFFSASIFAVSEDIKENTHNADFFFEPGNIFNADINTKAGYIDNFLFSESNKESTSFFNIAPTVFIQTEAERNLFQLYGKISYYSFNDFSDDNHNDTTIIGKYHYKFSQNQRLAFTGSFKDTFEYRGTGISQGDANALTEGDEMQNTFVNAGYYYGQEESVARLSILLGARNSEYTTRRDKTQIFDYEGQYLKGSFDYYLSGKSYFRSEFAYEQVSFDNNPIIDRDVYSALIGYKWESSIISHVDILLGFETLAFDASDREKDDKFVWKVDVNWSPVEYVNVLFNSTRTFQENNQNGSEYKVVDEYKLNIGHQFTDFVTASISLAIKNQDVIFVDSIREEDYQYAGLLLRYIRNERLNFYLEYNFTGLDSTKEIDNFDRNMISAGLTFKFD